MQYHLTLLQNILLHVGNIYLTLPRAFQALSFIRYIQVGGVRIPVGLRSSLSFGLGFVAAPLAGASRNRMVH